MLPTDPLTYGTLVILASAVGVECEMPQPTNISVIPRTAELEIDTSRSHQDIQGQEIDTINPFGYNAVTHTNGFMEGQLEVTSKVKLDFSQVPQYNSFCVWYEDVKIEINITPKITIAKEVAVDKCMYKAVLEHEMKHVNADRKIINKFAHTVGKKVYDGLKERGFIAGPMHGGNLKEIAPRMRQTVQQLVEFEYKKFEIERTEVQQKIDNLSEYKSVQAKCPQYRAPALQRVPSPVAADIGND